MGKVIMSGKVPKLTVPKVPSNAVDASTLAVGSTIYLKENGVAIPYLVVNQGIPGNSSLYDSSCDGMWLLRKDIYTNAIWNNSGSSNRYNTSHVHSFLNGNFLGLFDSETQAAIKQVKIPYIDGSTDMWGEYSSEVISGANGVSTKVFLLGGYEVNFTSATNTYFMQDGACLSYFSGASTTDSRRIAYFQGAAADWWLRAVPRDNLTDAYYVDTTYGYLGELCDNSNGIRPALILPSTAQFDEDTLEFMGVS